MQAAVANGADAVYFGVKAFNARQRADNFELEELADVMSWLHHRGVRGFLTFNVLVFSDELERAAELLLAADRAGVDAVIVQDVGLCTLARQLVPDLVLHASTQMSITAAAGVAQAAALGCQRVVLARELALKDLERLQRQLTERHLSMPLEVFVHGALCVAYSGQCLTSESLGQRSANRGECAQACRLPYQMVVDGDPIDLGDQRYLLSPQDLSAWEVLPQLQELGIASLKIEGRLKDATYVAAVTSAYRQRLTAQEDHSATTGSKTTGSKTTTSKTTTSKKPGSSEPPGVNPTGVTPTVKRQLELAFSRGLSSGWLKGINHRRLVHGRWSKKRGPLVGSLQRVNRGGWLLIRSGEPLRRGQGLVLEVHGDDPLTPPREIGGRVMDLERIDHAQLKLRLGPGRIDTRALANGASVWLTSDPDWESQWQKASRRKPVALPRPLRLRVRGRLGASLELELLVPKAAGVRLRSAMPLEAASRRPLDRQKLEDQLGRLGGTGWTLERLELDLIGDLFLPVAELNRMRRDLLERLEASDAALNQPTSVAKGPLKITEVLQGILGDAQPAQVVPEPGLVVLVRSLEQLRALTNPGLDGLPIRSVVADLDQPRQLREAVALGQGHWPEGIWLTGPRITRPDERWTLEPLIRARPDGYLVRNADQLETLSGLAPCIGDFSLNTANPLSVHWYRQRWGLERLTASYDLNLQQLLDLACAVDPSRLEVTLHQHMPLFHMEHCLFCAFLSDGHDHTDCGRPCEQHTVTLKDRSGVEHPLRADLGCRNTLFNGTAQTGVEGLPSLLRAGIRSFRLELLDEGPEDALRRVRLYVDALQGRRPSDDVWRQESINHQLGVTRGSLRVRGPERTSQFSR